MTSAVTRVSVAAVSISARSAAGRTMVAVAVLFEATGSSTPSAVAVIVTAT